MSRGQIHGITNNHAVMEEHFPRTDTPQFKQPLGNSQHTAQLHLHSSVKEKKKKSVGMSLPVLVVNSNGPLKSPYPAAVLART